MLTRRQKQIFEYIKKYIKENEYPPSLEEIGRYFKLSSLATVHQHVEALKSKGYLKDEPRTIQISENKKSPDLVEIPLLGLIAAGQPIEAIENKEMITVPKSYVAKSGKHYALRVEGNSMIDEGIFDGDMVIIREQKTADNGQTVVAIIGENEATLKKIYREKDRFRLQPANPSLFPTYRKEVEIRGIVVQIIRNLESLQPKKTIAFKLKRRIDPSWDFRNEKTKSYTHGFHNYPAMFIPQVARRLILTHSKKGDTICDIFCGSGTALVEAKISGRNAYGIDLNPLATFLAKVKTTPLNPSFLQNQYLKLLIRIKNIKSAEKPNFFNINYWFKKEVIKELSKIKKAILEIKNKDIRNFFLVAFSKTVRLSSNTKNGEFKLFRIKKEELSNYNPDVLQIFKTSIEKNIKGMNDYYKDINRNAWTKIISGDSSQDNGIKENSIDYIITSPPYGDSRTTVAYGQFSRLSLQWLDLIENNDLQIDNKLLGGRATRILDNLLPSKTLKNTINKIAKNDKKRAREVLSFYIDLNKCLKRAYKILKPKKYFCLVIGNRLVKQVRIPTDFIIAELGQNIGFICEDIIVRNIPGKRMPIKTSPTNIAGKSEKTMTKESIVVLRKL